MNGIPQPKVRLLILAVDEKWRLVGFDRGVRLHPADLRRARRDPALRPDVAAVLFEIAQVAHRRLSRAGVGFGLEAPQVRVALRVPRVVDGDLVLPEPAQIFVPDEESIRVPRKVRPHAQPPQAALDGIVSPTSGIF